MRLLERYIKEILNEEFRPDFKNRLVHALDQKSEEYNSKDEADKWYDMSDDFEKIAYGLGLRYIGGGASRRAYSTPDLDWVLKIAYNKDFYVWANKDEIDISQGEHSTGPRDIFVQTYSWDRVNDTPKWMIIEKVMTLGDASKELSIGDLAKVFPTFYDALEDCDLKRDPVLFCQYVSYVLTVISWNEEGPLSEEEFYEGLKEASMSRNVPQVKTIEEIRFGEDFRRLGRAYAFTRPYDMHDGNIGIRYNSFNSPQDIVILDYMLK